VAGQGSPAGGSVITQALLSVYFFVFGNTFGALPTSPTLGVNAQATNVVNGGLFTHLGWANAYFPVDAAVTGIGVLLALVTVIMVIRVVLWVSTKVHLLGGD
jgi:hypothetical protein